MLPRKTSLTIRRLLAVCLCGLFLLAACNLSVAAPNENEREKEIVCLEVPPGASLFRWIGLEAADPTWLPQNNHFQNDSRVPPIEDSIFLIGYGAVDLSPPSITQMRLIHDL